MFSTFNIIVSNIFCLSTVNAPPPVVELVAVAPATNLKLSWSTAVTSLDAGDDPPVLIWLAAIPPTACAPVISTSSPTTKPWPGRFTVTVLEEFTVLIAFVTLTLPGELFSSTATPDVLNDALVSSKVRSFV